MGDPVKLSIRKIKLQENTPHACSGIAATKGNLTAELSITQIKINKSIGFEIMGLMNS